MDDDGDNNGDEANELFFGSSFSTIELFNEPIMFGPIVAKEQKVLWMLLLVIFFLERFLKGRALCLDRRYCLWIRLLVF